jgi:hypothetical protein
VEREEKTIEEDRQIPRILWIAWLQGVDQAPPLVRRCIESWRRQNPEWDIRVLGEADVRDWVSLSIPEDKLRRMNPAHQAAHVRLRLLEAHGGVWADATCLCMRPLDDWLPSLNHDGFFVFRWRYGDVLGGTFGGIHPGRERLMASWFLMAAPGNYSIRRLSSAFAGYWTENELRNENKQALHRFVRRVLRRNPWFASYWVHPLFTKVLKVHPYLAINSLYTWLLKKDRRVALQWEHMTDWSAQPAHLLQEWGPQAGVTDELRARLATPDAPLQKLDWRMGYEEAPSNSMLRECLERHEANAPPRDMEK